MKLALLVLFGALFCAGTLTVAYEIWRMTVLDAEARGLEHPKLLGFLSVSGQNSSGLILYLLYRRRYPLIHGGDEMTREMARRKRAACAAVLFMAAGMCGLILTAAFA